MGNNQPETISAPGGIYIYCIIGSGEPQTFGPIGIGGNGDHVYTLSFQDLSAVVSRTTVKKFTVAREYVIPHERVIEEVMKTYTVLPVRFATIAGDEGRVRAILENEYEKFTGLLGKMEGKKELGVKALFKDDLIYRDILEKYEEIRTLKEKIAGLEPDKSRYQRMEIGRMVEAALEREREAHKDEILDLLSCLAVDVKVNKTYGDQMIVNAAFLVDKEKEGAFDETIQELSERYGDKVHFKYVGLLPPFNFVNLAIRTDAY